MALSFPFPGVQKKPNEIIAVDLGSRVIKAVLCESRGGRFTLSGYALLDTPIHDSANLPAVLLGEQLREVTKRLETRTKTVALAIGTTESFVRHVEIPKLPSEAIRPVLKNNTRTYFQTDLPGHVFDYQVIYQAVPPEISDQSKRGVAVSHQQRLVVAGAREQCVAELAATGKTAGLNVPHIIPGMICPINAFELVHPEDFNKQVVALVDIGFKHSTICILQQGELVLNRVIQIGGNRMTAAIAEELNISYAEAEGIKLGMSGEVQGVLEGVVSILSRELRASIDYFEHQHECSVSRVYVSGGPARSESIIEFLCNELMMDCITWNPTSFCKLTLSPTQSSEIDAVSHQLGVALGAAIAAL